MENRPTFSEYVSLIYNRFEAFLQVSANAHKMGHPYVYEQQNMIVFFMWMQIRRIFKFKAQGRWLKAHPEALPVLSWERVPHRTTLSRRYKALYPLLQEFILFLGQDSTVLGKDLQTQHLYEDKSLFKAQGAVWHQSDRLAGHIPDKLRQLDTDASWSKSAYHGWVYGYGLHLTCNHAGFPILTEVETATFSEKEAIGRKEACILDRLQPETLCGDDAYTLCKRIRTWAAHGIILLAPALRWRNGRYALTYRRFLKQPDMAQRLRARKTAIGLRPDCQTARCHWQTKTACPCPSLQCQDLYRPRRPLITVRDACQFDLAIAFSFDFIYSRRVCLTYAHPSNK